MQEWIIGTMDQFGYLGITLLIAIENIFPPIPSEVILAFGGFMTTYSNLNIIGVVLFATLGSYLGAILLYGIGRFLSVERLGRIADGKIGQLLRIKSEDIHSAYAWFERKGKLTVLFCRCVPIVRSLISIPAGMAKMHFGLFTFYTIAGSLAWNTILTCLGAIAGASWEKIVAGTDLFTQITVVVLGLLLVVVVYVFLKKRLKKSNDKITK